MPNWRVYSYDVWGNAKEGYDINNVFRTNEIIPIPYEVESNEEFIKYLRKIGFFRKSVKTKYVEIDGDEESLYFSYKGRPEFELRRE